MKTIHAMLFGLVRGYAAGRVIDGAKRRALVIYLRVVDGVRRSLVLLVLIGLVLQALTLSAFGALVTAVLLWGGDDKLAWLLGIFAVLTVIFGALGAFLLSERTWLRVSGAAELSGDA